MRLSTHMEDQYDVIDSSWVSYYSPEVHFLISQIALEGDKKWFHNMKLSN
jgi:hypothetical protein